MASTELQPEDDTTFEISLFEGGDGGFHHKNKENQLQREQILQYKSDNLTGFAQLYAVIHGEACGSPASLIILLFRFCNSERESRRFKSVQITTTFFSKSNREESDPLVDDISPQDVCKITGTKFHQQKVQRSSASFASSPGSSVFRVTSVNDNDIQATKFSAATIEGYDLCSPDRISSESDQACWTLYEDKIAEQGVRSPVFTAVLLKHQSGEAFNMQVELSASVTARSAKESIKRFFGRNKPVVDPVAFAEQGKRTDHRRKHGKIRFEALEAEIDEIAAKRSSLKISPTLVNLLEKQQWTW